MQAGRSTKRCSASAKPLSGMEMAATCYTSASSQPAMTRRPMLTPERRENAYVHALRATGRRLRLDVRNRTIGSGVNRREMRRKMLLEHRSAVVIEVWQGERLVHLEARQGAPRRDA